MQSAVLVHVEEDGKEYIAIITDPIMLEELKDDGAEIKSTVYVNGDFGNWPTNRLMGEN